LAKVGASSVDGSCNGRGFGWDNAFVDAGVGDRGKLGAKE